MPLTAETSRESVVLKDLAAFGVVQVSDLARKLRVSAVTIRKDLDALERRQLLRRIRGGAIQASSTDEGRFDYRLRRREAEKKAIARHAAELVEDGDTIALDASTTCYYLARTLLNRKDLVVITNGLQSAALLMEESNATVILPGGVLRRCSASIIAPFDLLLQGRGPITHGFFGAVSVSTEIGLMEFDYGEADTKRTMAAACLNLYGLVSSEKATQFGLHSFATPHQVTRIYTDEKVSLEFARDCAQAGMPVEVVSLSSAALDGDADEELACAPASLPYPLKRKSALL